MDKTVEHADDINSMSFAAKVVTPNGTRMGAHRTVNGFVVRVACDGYNNNH